MRVMRWNQPAVKATLIPAPADVLLEQLHLAGTAAGEALSWALPCPGRPRARRSGRSRSSGVAPHGHGGG